MSRFGVRNSHARSLRDIPRFHVGIPAVVCCCMLYGFRAFALSTTILYHAHFKPTRALWCTLFGSLTVTAVHHHTDVKPFQAHVENTRWRHVYGRPARPRKVVPLTKTCHLDMDAVMPRSGCGSNLGYWGI